MAVNIGIGNTIGPNNTSGNGYGPIAIGNGLNYTGDNEGVVILGQFNNETVNPFPEELAMVVGVGTGKNKRRNALELSSEGELFLISSNGKNAIVYTDGVQCSSDINLKTDIQPLDADYSVLQALQPVRYRFKADEERTVQFGFIAQEVERYFPHLVKTNRQGIKSLNYIGLLPVLWQYTQRLEQTVETQAAEIDRLKTEMESLKADIQAVKAAMGMGE